MFIDASVSMAGFGRAGRPQPFVDMIDAVGYTMVAPDVYRYGQNPTLPRGDEGVETDRVPIDRALSGPAFYTLPYNPDDLLIKRLTAEPRPALTALITDGVYSDSEETTLSSVVEAIDGWFEKGRSFAVLIGWSNFDGPFYSEQQRKMIAHQGTTRRPFYVFLFAPDERTLSDFIFRLRSKAPPFEQIVFTRDAIECEPPQLVEAVSAGSKAKEASAAAMDGSRLYDRSPRSAEFSWVMLSRQAFQRSAVELEWHVRCRADADYPGRFGVEPVVDYERWTDDNKPVAAQHARVRPRVKALSESTTEGEWTAVFAIRVPLTADPTGSYGLYTIRFVPRFGGVDPRYRDLSTTHDDDPEELGRTYYFARLIEGIATRHFERRLEQQPLQTTWVTVPGQSD